MSTSCSYTLNPDISGVGVRISYYLQTLFLGWLSVRSGSLDEIAGALYTLIATNTAMAVTGLILGLKPSPEISFQDAVTMLYLLSMGWITVLASLAACNRLSEDTKILQLVSVVQSGAIGAFAFAVLRNAATFGQSPDCNGEARAVIFRPMSALHSGRILGWIVIASVTTAYTIMTGRDILAQFKRIKNKGNEPSGDSTHTPSDWQDRSPGILKPDPTVLASDTTSVRSHHTDHGTPTLPMDGRLLAVLLFITIFWIFFVLNTELVIRWNQPTSANSGPTWEFGQILPLLLTLLPFISTGNAFREFGMRRTRRVLRQRMVTVICD
ncbi:hypothetical protein MSAN_01150300 [Mycena sanguinolenta]|uniref:Uncharacterized protein n=1 Tax=Mycena sanguinolenta TaxID=230812 RepID=A0A8H6YLF2_9AGAR|nr:hypothetical protein MSAN_01150300 [Mycena sanguinolenta]